MCNRTKFKKDDKEQLELGIKVLVASYNNMSTEKYMIKAVEKAFRPLKVDEKKTLPDTNAFVGYLKILREAVNNKQCPASDGYAYNSVLHDAYMEIVKDSNDDEIQGQMSFDSVDVKENVSVSSVCTQEDQMEADAAEIRIREEYKLAKTVLDDADGIKAIIRSSRIPKKAKEALTIRYELSDEQSAALVRLFADAITSELKEMIKKWEEVA